MTFGDAAGCWNGWLVGPLVGKLEEGHDTVRLLGATITSAIFLSENLQEKREKQTYIIPR